MTINNSEKITYMASEGIEWQVEKYRYLRSPPKQKRGGAK